MSNLPNRVHRGWPMLAAAAVLVGGCTTWSEPRLVTARTTTRGAETPRTDRLPGRGEISKQGELVFQVDGERLCMRTDVVSETTTFVYEKQLTFAGLAGLAIGTSLIGYGGLRMVSGESGALGFMMFGGAIALPVGVSRFFRPRRERHGERRTLPQSPQESACKDAAVASVTGALTVTTPWGRGVGTTVDEKGRAVFALDWRTTGIDPYPADAARARLGAAWRVSAELGGLSMDWIPEGPDTDRALAMLTRASSEPPVLVVAELGAEGDRLSAGRRSVVRLTVENRGNGAAYDVKARTRSSLPALHGIELDFGRIAPRESKTRTAEVRIARNEPEPSATVVVTISEGRGHVPESHTARLTIRPSQCPDGALDRKEYEKKLKALTRLVRAGAVTQPEFEQYEAELVECLQ